MEIKFKDRFDLMVKLLIKNEDKLKELYELYAQLDTNNSQFWLDIAAEESKHARLLENLHTAYTKENLYINTNVNFNMETVRNNIDYIEKCIAVCKEKDIPLKYLYDSALKFENSVIENEQFSIFDLNIQQADNIISVLKEETQKHIEQIRFNVNKMLK